MTEPALDLDAYLGRVGYPDEGPPRPDAASLHALHRAHATSIPFENLDIALGRPIRLDLPGLAAKLVAGRRGGYCFEQNTLLAAVLEQVGFPVARLAARVRPPGATRVLPRTHMLLRVEADGRPWLADAGFGSSGPLGPIPMQPDAEARHGVWRHRLRESDGLWTLQLDEGAAWRDLYAFTLEPQLPIDYELANYYVSTHPTSIFTQRLTVQRIAPEACWTLVGDELAETRPGSRQSRTIGEGELIDTLARTFGLAFPPGTTFRPPNAGGAVEASAPSFATIRRATP